MLLFGVAAMLAAGFSPVQSEIKGRERKVNLKLLQVVYFVLCVFAKVLGFKLHMKMRIVESTRVQGRGSGTYKTHFSSLKMLLSTLYFSAAHFYLLMKI